MAGGGPTFDAEAPTVRVDRTDPGAMWTTQYLSPPAIGVALEVRRAQAWERLGPALVHLT